MKRFLINCGNLLIFNPLVFTVLTWFNSEKMFRLANKLLRLDSDKPGILGIYVIYYGKNSRAKNRYWFHYATKLKYAINDSEKKFVIRDIEEESGLREVYDSSRLSYSIKRYIWRNKCLSASFREMMIKDGFTLSLVEFVDLLEKNEIESIRYVARQTISDHFAMMFWEFAQQIDRKKILLEFVDYVLREGLTPRVVAFIMNSQQSFARSVVSKALSVHDEVAFVNRSKPNEMFRESLLKGKKFSYEAQCVLDVDLYKIYRNCNYKLDENAVIYHLKKADAMAKEILSENREFSIEALRVIISSPKLSSWYRTRI